MSRQRDTSSARIIVPAGQANRYAQQLRNAGWRGPISLAEPNPQPYEDIEAAP